MKGFLEEGMEQKSDVRDKGAGAGSALLARSHRRRTEGLGTIARIQPPLAQPPPPRDQNQLARYWNVITDHKLLVACVLVGCLGIAAIVAALEPSNYRAKSSVELMGVNANFLNLQSIDPTAQLSGGAAEAESYFQTQIELLKTDGLVERAVKRTQLDKNARFVAQASSSFTGKIKGALASLGLVKASAEELDEASRVHAAVSTAQKHLKVQQVHQSNLVEISFEDTDPKVALSFANAVTEEAVNESLESRLALSRNVRQWLEKHLGDLRSKMDAAEKELLAYSAQTGLVNTGAGVTVDDSRLQRIQDQLARAQGERIQKETLNTLSTMADPQSLPEVLDDPVLREYRVRLADLKKQEADISSTFTPAYPKARRLQTQISDLEAAMAKEVANIQGRIRNEYNTAKRNEEAVNVEYTSQANKVGVLAQKTVHYNTFKRELETTQSMYEEMLKRVNDTELASVVKSSGIRIVDPASFPDPPSKTKALFICSIGLFVGLMITGVIVFILDQTSNTLSEPGYAAALLSVTELGIIPSVTKKDRSLLAGSSSRTEIATGGQVTTSGSILTLTRQSGAGALEPGSGTSLFEDSFRSSINSILFALEEAAENGVIAVSSPGPSEGKTTITANLGTVLGEIGNRVLLIDADLRKPSLHSMFNLQNSTGLADLLSGGEPVTKETLKSSVQRPANARIDVLTAGVYGSAAFDLFNSKRIIDLIEIARKEYSLVLIDTAPLLIVPESRILGRLADWSILVLRAGRTTGDAALAARQQMADDQIPLLGTILNDCKRRRNSNGYWY